MLGVLIVRIIIPLLRYVRFAPPRTCKNRNWCNQWSGGSQGWHRGQGKTGRRYMSCRNHDFNGTNRRIAWRRSLSFRIVELGKLVTFPLTRTFTPTWYRQCRQNTIRPFHCMGVCARLLQLCKTRPDTRRAGNTDRLVRKVGARNWNACLACSIVQKFIQKDDSNEFSHLSRRL